MYSSLGKREGQVERGREEGESCRDGESTGRLEIEEKRGSPLIFGRSGVPKKRDGEEDCKQDLLSIPNRSRAAGERKVKSTKQRRDGENQRTRNGETREREREDENELEENR